MTELLSKAEHEILRQDVADNRASIFITRNMARQFYTHVGHRNVRDLTGQSVVRYKITVLGLLVTALLTILGCLIMLIVNFGWVAIVIVPLTGIFWTVIVGFTTEQGSLPTSFATLIAVILPSLLLPPSYLWPVTQFAASVFCYRLAHILAQSFLHQLVMDSYDAFDMLTDHIEIIRNED